MGTRILWLCLYLGAACSPKPALQSTQSNNGGVRAAARDGGFPLTDGGETDAASTISGFETSRAVADKRVDASAELPPSEAGVNLSPQAVVDAGARPLRLDAGQDNPGEATADAEAQPDTGVGADASPGEGGSDAAVCALPNVVGSECALTSNCGCDEGAVCRVADRHTGQTLCFPPGTTPLNARCDLDQDCEADAVCETGLCRAPCDNPGHYCLDGSSCAQLSAGGRDVCVGHCNVLTRSPDVWSRASEWVKLMARQEELGKRTESWYQDYTDCGEGAYCHPGLGPTETSDARPLYPHCMPSTGEAVDNSTCRAHTDCVSGLACGIYPNEQQGRCIRLGFVEGDCKNTGHGLEYATNIHVEHFIAPDGLSKLGLCTKALR